MKYEDKPQPDFTLEEVAKEMLIELGMELDAPGFTSKEYAEVWGVADVTARKRIAKLKAQGKLTEGLRTMRRHDGSVYYAPVYLLKKKAEEEQ